MRKALLVLLLCAASACADMVVQRWGVSGHVQHPNTLRYESAGAKGTMMIFDLSALPAGAKVYRARLVFARDGMYGQGFDIVPADAARCKGLAASAAP